MRVAITGHRDLDSRTARMVDTGIRRLLAQRATDVTGVTCLAEGADQIFARAILAIGGRLEVIIPATGYEAGLEARARDDFEELAEHAVAVRRLPYRNPGPRSYLHAGLTMLDGVERLIAVWDGAPARGRGGTAEIVGHARQRRIDVDVLWPQGATRVA
ncbi:hypothetical protein [Actinomadura mexicana]|uniref:DNA recombination-mediator protein A n=1 Tax=Actinomadura mexicana TaxID=134959 RepID=A0A239GZ35_9ACTN|nr:hypothetical protein [Actinomadura mexicana]SNS74162.1 hypothetical protein SAMN06265355_12720 [Actinomadura mexicana]